MHKYEKLEKEYYKKRIFKILIISFLTVFLIFIIFYIININHNQTNKKINFRKNLKKIDKNISKDKNKSSTIIFNKEKNFSKKNNLIDKRVIKKEINKTKNVINKTINKNNLPTIYFVLPNIEINKTLENSTKEMNTTKIKNKKKYKKEKEIKHTPIIIEESIKVDDLINSFKANPSFDLAIQISEYYLNKNNLDLAKLWALKANSINPKRYESWKIFAIILLKRQEKDEAKEVLQTYLNDYGENENIQKLLRSIDE